MLWAKTVAGFMQRFLIIARKLVFGIDPEVASYYSVVGVIALSVLHQCRILCNIFTRKFILQFLCISHNIPPTIPSASASLVALLGISDFDKTIAA